MQWILCRVVQCISIIEVASRQLVVIGTDGRKLIQRCVGKGILSECSGLGAVWPNGARFNAVDSMKHV